MMEADPKCDEALSPIDTGCLLIEDRTTAIVNVGALVFAEPIAFNRVR